MKGRIVLGLSFLFFISCEVAFVEDISGETVELLAPANNTQVAEGTVNFNWNSVTEAEQYRLQIAIPSFANASQIVVDTTITSTTFNKNLVAGEYEWRVKASNSEYETSFTTNAFTVN